MLIQLQMIYFKAIAEHQNLLPLLLSYWLLNFEFEMTVSFSSYQADWTEYQQTDLKTVTQTEDHKQQALNYQFGMYHTNTHIFS